MSLYSMYVLKGHLNIMQLTNKTIQGTILSHCIDARQWCYQGLTKETDKKLDNPGQYPEICIPHSVTCVYNKSAIHGSML